MSKLISVVAVLGIAFAIYHWAFGSKIPAGMDKDFYNHAVQAELDIQKIRTGSDLNGYDNNSEAVSWLLEGVNTATLTPQEKDMYTLLSRQLLDATVASSSSDVKSGEDYNSIEKQVTQTLDMK
ncbi:hypothetical protein [Bacillus sp. EB600]|uniref:hypothetical protein n=1 Tax=Bacillus sp. EB600 TaxID=2806345 RepID=UPI00210A29D0|nr:hypothetical protein [Bacillus sp. EB600]MCQ6282705.1 hypothetical protein [Bacillus sp. EB600]